MFLIRIFLFIFAYVHCQALNCDTKHIIRFHFIVRHRRITRITYTCNYNNEKNKWRTHRWAWCFQYINILLINDAMCECVNVSHTNSCRNVCMCMSVHTSCIEHFSLGKCISSTIGHFINDDNRIFHCMCYFNIIGHFCIFSFTSLLFDKYVVMRHKMIFSYIYIFCIYVSEYVSIYEPIQTH